VNAVRPPDLERLAVLLRPRRDGGERAVELRQDQSPGLANLERERGVDDV